MLIDAEFCIAHHGWGYFDIRLGNCIESYLNKEMIAHRDGSELSDSMRVRQVGDDLDEKWPEIKKTDLSCLIGMHKVNSPMVLETK